MLFDSTIFDRQYFEENEFMHKYLNLLNSALTCTYIQGEFSEKHHVLPRALFKLYGKEYKSTRQNAEVNKNNLVQLSIKDHILAHYYLALFSINELKKPMCYGFLAMLDRDISKLLPSELELLKMLPELEQIKIERNRLASENRVGKKPWNYGLTKDTNKSIALGCEKSKEALKVSGWYAKQGEARRGKIWISKNMVNKLINEDELAIYLADGWLRGLYISEKGKEAQLKAAKFNKGATGKVWINNTLENKFVDKCELDTFLASGWVKGRMPDKINLEVKKKNDADHAIRMKNKKHIHNSITGECIRVDVSEINEYLSNGWVLGNPKIAENNRNRKVNLKGKIYINNGIKNLLISKEELDDYLSKGWLRGKKKQKT